MSNAVAVPSVNQLRMDGPFVCLASMMEVKKAIKELMSPHPMALLAPGRVENMGTTQLVKVNVRGRVTTWERQLIQLGKQPVIFDHENVTKGGDVGSTNMPVVIYGIRGRTPEDVWQSLEKNPKSIVDKWLKNTCGLKTVGVLRRPKCADGNNLQVVAEVAAEFIEEVVTKSAVDGLFSRHFVSSDEERAKHKIVPLDVKHDRPASLRIAGSLQMLNKGVVPTRRGWGIRVLAENFEQVLREVNPAAEAWVTGTEYVVSGLPLSWHAENVKKFLGPWEAQPLGRPFQVGFRHTWTVRASQPPPAETLRNPDSVGLNVLAQVTKKEHRPAKPKKVLVWNQTKGQSTSTAQPKSWASVVQNPNGPEPKPPASAVRGMAGAPVGAPTPGSVPENFMEQLQNMFQQMLDAKLAPIHKEMAAMREVMDEEALDQAEADMEGEEESEDEQGGSGNVPEPSGRPPKPAKTARQGPY